MIRHNQRLSKPRGSSSVSSSQHYSVFIKGGVLVALTILLYLHHQISDSILDDTDYQNSNYVSKSNSPELQALDVFSDGLPTAKLTIQEWIRQTETPLIGLYRYSSVATIQLPTADLEEQEKLSNQVEEVPLKEDINLSNNNDIVVLTRKGYKNNPEDGKRTPNQDRVMVLSRHQENIQDNHEAKAEWWMGLFDGHGYYGHAVSQYVSLKFARRINKDWEGENSLPSSNVSVKAMLKAIFLDINKSMHSLPGIAASAGCTGISVLKRGNSLYISNVGDSVGFVASYNKSKKSLEIIYSTKPHKPDSSSERKRIEEAGGRVIDPPFQGMSARLAIPMENGVSEMALAMSRSFGDLDGEKVGLSVEPDTDVIDLSQFDKSKEYFVVAATDGLIDFAQLTEEEVATAMTRAMSGEEDQSHVRSRFVSARGTKAARELILKSSKMWSSKYRDDISIVAHKIRF